MHFVNPVDNVHFARAAPLPAPHYPVLRPERGQDVEQVKQGLPEPRTVHVVFLTLQSGCGSQLVTSLIHQLSIIKVQVTPN